MSIFQLPTFLIGPSQGARSSTILERSAEPEALPEAERRLLNDLPLGIAGWMRRRDEDEIYGCLPLSRAPLGGRLLFRAQYLHDLGGEPYGLAAGLYLTRELLQALNGHAEHLAGVLPVPERDSPFTQAPLALDPARLPPLPEPVAIGLEWDDRAVQVADGAEPLAVVRQLLAGLGHPPQDRRVRGWVTTARFPQLGSIDPRASFQLVVSRTALGDETYLAGTWADGAYHGAQPKPPAAWPAWQALHAGLSDDPQLANACGWASNLAELEPDQVAGTLLQRVLAWPKLGPDLFLRLLARLGETGTVANPAGLLRAQIEQADDLARSPLLSALLKAPLPVRQRLHATELLRARPALVSLLDPAAFGVALGELALFDWPELERRHVRALPTDARFAALDFGLTQIETNAAQSRYLLEHLQALVESLIDESNSLVQADPRNAAIARRIDQLQSAGLDQIVGPRLRILYEYWLTRLPAEVSAPLRGHMLRINRDFPISLDDVALLSDLIAVVNRAGGQALGGAKR